jgi:polar amino acid transport system substrate-binding protein
LPGKRIATVSETTSAKYLDSEDLAYTGVTRIDEAYNLLEQGEVQAVVYDAPVLMYFATKQGRGKVEIAGSTFHADTYGIAFPTGSSLREPINNSLLRLRQNGTYDTIYAKWFQPEN